MKLSDWTRNLTQALLEMNASRDRDALLVVKEGIALVKLRVINEGIRADGGKFSAYSKPYAKKRKTAGRPINFKNFSFGADMWASIREFIKSKSKFEVVVEIRSSIALYNDTVIQAHSNREGINILQTSPDERKLIFEVYRERRLNVLRRNGVIR